MKCFFFTNLCCFFGCWVRHIRISCALFTRIEYSPRRFLCSLFTNWLMFTLSIWKKKRIFSNERFFLALPKYHYWNFDHRLNRDKVEHQHRQGLLDHRLLDRSFRQSHFYLFRTCQYWPPSRCMAQNSLLSFFFPLLFFFFFFLLLLRSASAWNKFFSCENSFEKKQKRLIFFSHWHKKSIIEKTRQREYFFS